MTARLSRFAIIPADEDYVLRFEDEDGETHELTASYEQLDIILDTISDQLDGDEEEALEVDEND